MNGRPVLPALIAVLLLLMSSGCPMTPAGFDGYEPAIDAEFEQRSDLFVEDGEEPGSYEFFTNDPDLWGPYGYTLWALMDGERQEPFAARQVVLSKASGDGSAGYGVVICHYDTGDPELGETMLVVMINTKQKFLVGEVTGARFESIIWWTHTEKLTAGYNVPNTIRIEYDDGTSVFSLHVNGSEQAVATFRDEQAPFHSGGADGHIVVISPLDRFPQAPVHVLFTEIEEPEEE